MKKVIDNLDKLEKFVLDESIDKSARYEVFAEALRGFEFFVLGIKAEESNEIDDPEDKVVPEMLRVISEIRASKPFPTGFVVKYKKGNSTNI
ncbi:hypothetical protein [Flavobacterium sp.]|uniref:hypothetical protein n=1 Tax=Flavobacterium sp. TaxID=239 RepID=UPI002BF5383E|nr:hypothetical protein [Flavobacterium sp.]HSD06968.1 hypothetical protein [Flavobacterium sp.]